MRSKPKEIKSPQDKEQGKREKLQNGIGFLVIDIHLNHFNCWKPTWHLLHPHWRPF